MSKKEIPLKEIEEVPDPLTSGGKEQGKANELRNQM